MKLLLELLLSWILHPVAFVLALINIAGRTDLNTTQKVILGDRVLLLGDRADALHPAGQGRLW